MVFLYPNHEIEALRSQGTREAISAAINRERLVDIAMFGYTDQPIAHLTVMAFQRGSPSSIGRPSFIQGIVKRFRLGRQAWGTGRGSSGFWMVGLGESCAAHRRGSD